MRRPHLPRLVWYSVLLCAHPLSAVPVERLPSGEPPLRFRNLSTEDGLPINDVRGIVRDAQGYLWFGTTQAGLCRYDGYSFKTYAHDPGDAASLISNGVWTMRCDRQGTLWVATNGGLERYDPSTDRFVHFRHDPGNPDSLPHDEVLTILEDSRGTLWVGSRGGLSRFERATGKFTTFRRPPHTAYGVNVNTIRCIVEDPTSDLLWVGASDGLGAFDRRTENFATFLRPPQGTEPLNAINEIVRDGDALWVLTESGLLHFRPNRRTIREPQPEPEYPAFRIFRREAGGPGRLLSDFLRSGLIDRENRFWIGSKDGLQLFDRATGHVTPVPHSPFDPETIADTFVNRLYEEPDGQLWVGTRYGGASRLRRDGFVNFRPPQDGTSSRARGAINSLHFDRAGRLWLGTAGGLYSLSETGWGEYRHDPADPGSLSDDYVSTIREDASGRLWVGTFNAGMNRFDGTRFDHPRRPLNSPEDPNAPVLPYTGDQFTSLLPLPDGGMWLGARAYGIDRFHDGKFLHYPPSAPGRPALPTGYAVFGTIAPDGALWYGTANFGLVRMEPGDGGPAAFTTYFVKPEEPTNQLNKTINCVFDDRQGSLWVGNPGGLHHFDLAARRFVRTWSRRDGFANDTVCSVVDDADGNLWIGTAGGLTRLDPATGHVRNFRPGDGLPGAQMATDAALRLPDGRLVFGSLAGVVVFDPRKLPEGRTPPPVVITGISVLNNEVRPGTPGAPSGVGRELVLQSDQNIISFRFAALDFTSPMDNRYEYRMENFDTQWRETSALNRVATYTNLPSGEYTFRVRGANNLGVWNKEGAALRVVIHPPWWATWWARLLDLVIAGAAVLALLRWRTRRIAQSNTDLQNQVEERRQAEAIVRRSEERFRALYEDNPAMYFTLDSDGSVLSVNRFGAHLLGFEVHEITGRPVTELFHPDDRAAARREIEGCLARPGELVRLEARKLAKDGRVIWVKELARSVVNAEGRPVVLVVCEDITARVELETQLRQAQKMEAFGQLAGGVAHDFNNILSVVLGQAQLAQDPNATPAEMQESLTDITQAALRARNLTRQLLAFSRRQAMLPVPTDLNQVVQNLARMLERLLGEPIALTLDLAPEPVPVYADVAMLEQVLVNLAVNARDAMPRGGKLTLRTRLPASPGVTPPVPAGRVRLDVQDSGVGIPADVQLRLFEPFFTTKEVGKGTGLGLATSLGIIQQHHGNITVQSAPGAGANFRIELPLHRLETTPAVPPPERTPPKGGGETILLVEDEAPVRLSARRVLERAGYRVIEATHGEEGLHLWEQRRAEIDFVLTDVVMPGNIMGRDLVARLRQQAPNLKFGYMSGYAPDSERSGPVTVEDRAALLAKPFEIDALLKFVRERLGR